MFAITPIPLFQNERPDGILFTQLCYNVEKDVNSGVKQNRDRQKNKTCSNAQRDFWLTFLVHGKDTVLRCEKGCHESF